MGAWARPLGAVAALVSIATIATFAATREKTPGSFDSSPSLTALSATAKCVYTVSDQSCNDPEAPVLEGVDVVEYFFLEDGRSAVYGSSSVTSVYDGYTYWFSSVENKEKFDQDPDTYSPQFGGFCAFALSGNDPRNSLRRVQQLYSAPVDPDQYLILSGKLYLFRGSEAKYLFLENADVGIVGGEVKWESWFGSACHGFMNTMCFMETA